MDKSVISQARFVRYDPLRDSGTLMLDGQTLQNLEVLENGMVLEWNGRASHNQVLSRLSTNCSECPRCVCASMLHAWACWTLYLEKWT